MNPNHYLAVAIDYLYTHRAGLAGGRRGRQDAGSSSMIDRVAARPGPAAGGGAGGLQVVRARACSTASGVFGGEESAGRLLRALDGNAWSTDKDGILLALLASEIPAVTGNSPSRALRAG